MQNMQNMQKIQNILNIQREKNHTEYWLHQTHNKQIGTNTPVQNLQKHCLPSPHVKEWIQRMISPAGGAAHRISGSSPTGGTLGSPNLYCMDATHNS